MASQTSQSMQYFRDRVRAILISRELTVTDLAADAGVTREGLSRVLHGRADCSIPYAEQIATALGVSLGDLLDSQPATKKRA